MLLFVEETNSKESKTVLNILCLIFKLLASTTKSSIDPTTKISFINK